MPRQKGKDIGKSEKEMIGYDTASERILLSNLRSAISHLRFALHDK